MKVRVTDLPPEGLNVNDTISLEALNARMAEGTYNDIQFIQAPRVELTLTPTAGGGVCAKGKVHSKYKQPCGRCLDPLERDIEVDADYTLLPRPAVSTEQSQSEQDEECIDDVGLVFYDGDQVELEELIQESLILALSIFWTPPCDEAGACKICGFNIDTINAQEAKTESQTRAHFGDLLKNAEKKSKKKPSKEKKKKLH